MAPATIVLDGVAVLVAGGGTSGAAAARAARDRGALVTVADASQQRRDALQDEGFAVSAVDAVPAGTALVVTSPGWRPDAPLLLAAAAAGIEVIGEVELAWRLRGPDAAPWLAVTGTNGKTTTVRLVEAVLRAAGHRCVAAGNVGLPLVDAVLATQPYDVLAVELSSFQLHWSRCLPVYAAALLNVADDHTDWHGSFDAYAMAKAKIWLGPATCAIGNLDDRIAGELLRSAPGAVRVGYTLAAPQRGQLGVVQDLLVDRAFGSVTEVRGTEVGGTAFGGVPDEGTELASIADLTINGGHNVSNALAAAALARSYGVPADAVRRGFRAFRAEPHRNQPVAGARGISWVDDSKATNPHAAAASLAAYPSVVWIAGGLLKGADVDALVAGAGDRLRAVVLLGTDRGEIRRALARHAPEVPVSEVSRLDTQAMSEAVFAAARLALPGDTVLLAPAAASMDCFRDYNQRGELFADLAREVAAT